MAENGQETAESLLQDIQKKITEAFEVDETQRQAVRLDKRKSGRFDKSDATYARHQSLYAAFQLDKRISWQQQEVGVSQPWVKHNKLMEAKRPQTYMISREVYIERMRAETP